MDDYPSFPISFDSQWLPASFRVSDFDASGQPRTRDLLPSDTPYAGTIVHSAITDAEKATLTAFYDAHRLSQFNLLFASVTYVCSFGPSAPRYYPILGGLWRAECDMMSEGL